MSTLLRRGAVAVVLAASLTACSGDDSDDAAPEPTASIDPDRTSPSDLPEVPEIENFEGAVADVEVGDCPTEAGDNEVSGSVENSTDAVQDYVITISWITARSDVVGRGVATIEDLPAGESRDWSVTGTLESAGDYTCTTQVQRGEF